MPTPSAHAVACAVLGDPAPVDGALTRHGPAATTRRYSRALVGATPLVLLLVVVVVAGGPAWILVGAVLPLGVAWGFHTVEEQRAAGKGVQGQPLTARWRSSTRSVRSGSPQAKPGEGRPVPANTR